jgi:thiamine kinase-like enzyme
LDALVAQASGMSPADIPEAVLSRIPGWGGAHKRKLAGGLTNQTYLVEREGRRAVLKIDSTPRTTPYNSREAEARIQTAAAESHLAGRVLFVDSTVYLVEYLEGCVWTRATLNDEHNLVDLANALRELHALPLTGRTFDAKLAAHKYMEKIDGAGTLKFGRCMDIIESMPVPQDPCCCHNDLVVENIIAMPELRFIDWEYACDNDPFFDLATIVAHHDLPEGQIEILMGAYFGGDAARWRDRLAMYVRLYDSLHCLWRAAGIQDRTQ